MLWCRNGLLGCVIGLPSYLWCLSCNAVDLERWVHSSEYHQHLRPHIALNHILRWPPLPQSITLPQCEMRWQLIITINPILTFASIESSIINDGSSCCNPILSCLLNCAHPIHFATMDKGAYEFARIGKLIVIFLNNLVVILILPQFLKPAIHELTFR